MQINKAKFESVVEEAKAKAANDPKWLRAIERAAREILSGEMIVTLFADDTALVTTANGSYRVNGHCICRAAQNGHTQCAHRAGKRLMATYEETAPEVVSPEPVATNCDKPATSAAPARYCGDRDLQRLDACAPHFRSDVAASSRQHLIIEIKNIWSRTQTTPLAVELMARFGKNKLEMLDDEALRRVRLAIAM